MPEKSREAYLRKTCKYPLDQRIRCTGGKKVLYTFTFPVFMLTYVPICIVSLFARVEWKPILHDKVMTLEQIESSGLRAS